MQDSLTGFGLFIQLIFLIVMVIIYGLLKWRRAFKYAMEAGLTFSMLWCVMILFHWVFSNLSNFRSCPELFCMSPIATYKTLLLSALPFLMNTSFVLYTNKTQSELNYLTRFNIQFILPACICGFMLAIF